MITEPDRGCVLWDGPRTRGGYGLVSQGGTRAYVHRLVMAEKLGRELLPGEEVLHACDNPPCMNPQHLSVGSHADNMRDAKAKGRIVNLIADANRRKTHCKRGHEFTAENTRITVDGRRNCRTCLRMLNEKYADKRYANRRKSGLS